MKKLIILFIWAVCSVIVKAEDAKPVDNFSLNVFGTLLSSTDLSGAESFLEEWEAREGETPEIYNAKFALLLQKALAFREAQNSVSEDSIINLAFQTINKGIEAYPNRLDLRFSKVGTYEYLQDWENAMLACIEILEASRDNGSKWEMPSCNEQEAKERMFGMIHGYEYSLSDKVAENKLLELNIEYFPDDYIAYINKSKIESDLGDYDSARNYLDKAYEVAPEDSKFIVMFFMRAEGPEYLEKAKVMCDSVLRNKDADEKMRAKAQEMRDYLSEISEIQEMDLYPFEFQFLPSLATQLSPGKESQRILCNPKTMIKDLPFSNGYIVDLNPKDVKVTKVGEGVETAIVWTMPDPEKMPFPKYIAFVPNSEKSGYSVYYLELSISFNDDGQVWVLGRSEGDSHRNFGLIPYPETAEKFIESINKRMKAD